MKKGLCLLLGLLLLLLTVVSCGEKKPPADQTPASDESTTVPVRTDEPGTEKEYKLELPERSFKNGDIPREFTMLCRQNRIDQFFQENAAIGSSQLEKAVYERNCFVEETYGVEINCITTSDSGPDNVKGSEFNTKLAASAMANSNQYDVVAPDYYWGCETKGYFANLYDLDYLYFDAPWWWTAWNECFTIDNKLTSAVGWLTLDIVQGMEVVYFNPTMMENLGYNDIYSEVYDKTWTIERMMEIGKAATYGINEDGSLEDGYVYGTILHYMGLRNLFFSLGGRFASYDEDDRTIYYDFVTPTNEAIAQKLTKWLRDGYDSEVYYCAYGTVGHDLGVNERPTVTAQMFSAGHSLFYCYGLKTAELLVSLNTKFGILPAPLMNGEQENYISTTFGTSYFAIERHHPEEQKNFAAFILEALNYYSYTMVKDVYYIKTLKLRYASDVAVRDMLDFVVENTYLDFAYLTSSHTGNLMGKMLSCITNGTALSTAWISLEGSALEKLQTYLQGYLK